jgi:hypothetical protein
MMTIIFRRLRGKKATIVIIRKNVGTAIIISTIRIPAKSTPPPKYPRIAPIIMPMTLDIPTATNPTESDILLP